MLEYNIIRNNEYEVNDMTDATGLYEEKAALLKALSHPVRLQIVRGLLRCGCRNVGCMEANVGQSQSCISQHLMRLKAAGIVKASRSGNEVYYEIDDRAGVTAIIAALFGDREEDYRHDL